MAQRSHRARPLATNLTTVSTGRQFQGVRALLKELAHDVAFKNRRSLRALDATVFFLADVQDGLGPFLAIYLLRVQSWNPSSVGVAMASMVLGTLTAQIPAGALIDRVRWKRAAVVIGAGVVATCCIVMGAMPTLPIVATMQALVGAAAAIMPPAIAGISLGLVGRKRFPRRTSRNEAFNHSGNVFAAVLAGTVGTLIGYWTIFYLVAMIAAASAISVCWFAHARYRPRSRAARTAMAAIRSRAFAAPLHRSALVGVSVFNVSLSFRERRHVAAGRSKGLGELPSHGGRGDVGVHRRGRKSSWCRSPSWPGDWPKAGAENPCS